MPACEIDSRMTVVPRALRRGLAVLLLLFVAVSVKPAFAGDNNRVSFAQRIVVEQNETVDDLVCFFCSIEVHGNVDGDIVSFLGGVKSDGQMHGDLVSFLGDVSLSGSAALDGQIVVMGGNLKRGAEARVGENQVIFPASIFLIPCIFIAAILWGISRVFRRRPVYFRPLR